MIRKKTILQGEKGEKGMKKTKLIGVLALTISIFAGCANSEPEKETGSTKESSTQVADLEEDISILDEEQTETGTKETETGTETGTNETETGTETDTNETETDTNESGTEKTTEELNENETTAKKEEETTSGSVKDESKIKKPVLVNPYANANGYVSYENGYYVFDLGLSNWSTDYYDKSSDSYTAEGYEVYEKVGTTYKYIGKGSIGGAAVISIEAGTSKTLVSRVYKYDSSNQKIYSEYSNELVLDCRLKKPVLVNPYANANGYVGYENGYYVFDLGLSNWNTDYYDKSSGSNTAAGYEVYEKVGTTYKYIGKGSIGGAAVISIEAGTSKTLVARVYKYDSSNQKIYSEYSNELVLDCRLKKPVLVNPYANANGYVGYENGYYVFDLGLSNWNTDYYDKSSGSNTAAGYEVYEKVGTTYKYIGKGSIGGAAVISIEAGTSKTLVARL